MGHVRNTSVTQPYININVSSVQKERQVGYYYMAHSEQHVPRSPSLLLEGVL